MNDARAGDWSDRLRLALLTLSLSLLLLVGLSRPNAAAPDLGDAPWAPGILLPFALSPAAVLAVLWVGYAAGAVGVLLSLRRPVRALPTPLVAGLGLVLLLTRPFGSADHVSYAAYGRILVQGGDPYADSPIGWHGGLDPVTSHVEDPWTTEPSVYGPVATLLHGLSALLGGDHLRGVVWVWQVLVVLSWFGVRALLRDLAPSASGRVDTLWTANPLVLGPAVLGAHVDVVAAFLMVLALWLAVRAPGRSAPVLAGLAVGLAASVKFPYGVLAVGLVALWWHRPRRYVVAGAAALAVLLGGSLWAGPHVLDQLSRSRQFISLASLWRPVLEGLRGPLGGGARTLVLVLAPVLAFVVAVLVWRLLRPRSDAPGLDRAVRLVAALGAGYLVAAPYSLPWYDALLFCILPLLAPSPVDALAVGRLTVLAAAYVPGRVLGMTAAVQSVSMGFRQRVAPWLGWLLLAATAWLARRRSGSPPG